MNPHTRLRLYALTCIVASIAVGIRHGAAYGLFAALALASWLTLGNPRVLCVNSLGPLATGIIIQEALSLVFSERPVLKNISLNFRDLDGNTQLVSKGQSVTCRLLTVPAVANFGSAATDRADTDVSVTLSNFKQVFYSFTGTEIASTNRQLIQESARPMAQAIANYMVDSIAALWIAANFTVVTTQASGWNYGTLTAMNAVLNARGVPKTGRFFAANSTVYKGFLDDTTIVAALNNPNNANAITTGRLPNVANFGIEEYPALPTTGNMVAFAGSPDSTAFAARPPRDPAELIPGAQFPGNSGYITEPITGMTVRVDEWIGTDLSANVRLCWLDGKAVGNPNNGQLIKTS